jgi:hypothetical protein
MALFTSQSQFLHPQIGALSWYYAKAAFNADYTGAELLRGASIRQLNYKLSTKLPTFRNNESKNACCNNSIRS